jgi:hypothetical protein
MKQIKLPEQFDGGKFMARYSLALKDFFVRDGMLHFPDHLPDVPVFEAPTVVIPLRERLNAMTPQQVQNNLKSLLLELLQ